jgi:hypothetical protein
VGVGTFFSNLVMYFIILTTALTLHRAGIMQIDTIATRPRDSASSLRQSTAPSTAPLGSDRFP